MMIDLEDSLRSALATRAASVPDAIAEQLRSVDYEPRSAGRGVAVVFAGTALAVGIGAMYLAASTGEVPTGNPAVHTSPGRETVQLEGYTLTLPEHLRASGVPCAPKPPGASGMPETVVNAGGQFVPINSGCLNIDLGGLTPPPDSQPVSVGTYYGYVVDDETRDTITLYVDGSTTHMVVFTATGTGLSEHQLITIATDSLVPCRPDLENAPDCN